VEEQLKRIVEFADVVRVVAHTQIKLLKLRQKRAHVMEIQVHTQSNLPRPLSFCRIEVGRSLSKWGDPCLEAAS
jgi:large subunit ribosomal protein L3e